MTEQELLDEFVALPADAQRQVVDFIALMRRQYRAVNATSEADADLANDKFIGMWSKRDDLADSASWVRSIRHDEWSEPHG